VRYRQRLLIQNDESISNRCPDCRLDERLILKSLINPRRSPLKRLPNCRVSATREFLADIWRLVCLTQDILLEEVIYRPRNGRVGGRLALGLPSCNRLPGAYPRGHHQDRRDQSRHR